MSWKKNGVVGLEVGRSYIKMAGYTPDKGQVTVVAIKPIEAANWEDDAYLSSEIQDCFKKHLKSNPSQITASVHGENAVVRLIEVPNEITNVHEYIHWELEQYLVRPLNEYLIDYQSLGSNAAEDAKKYLVAGFIRKEVERLRAILESVGVPLTVLDVDIFAAINVFEANYPDLAQQHRLLIKADSHSIQCVWIRNGMITGYEALPVAEGLLLADGEEKTSLIEQTVETLIPYMGGQQKRSSFDEPITGVVFCGDLAADYEFSQIMESRCPQELVRLNAFKEIPFATSHDQMSMLNQAAPQCAAAVGLALRQRGDC